MNIKKILVLVTFSIVFLMLIFIIGNEYMKKYVPTSQESIRKALIKNDLNPIVLIPSEDEIAKLLEKANQGDAEAAYRLGKYYFAGMGVTYNFDKAFKWFSVASKSGYTPATVELGRMYDNGWGVAKNDTTAFNLYSSVASENLYAKYLMAGCIKYGSGTVMDFGKAYAIYSELVDPLESAAMKGDANAQGMLSFMYYFGDGVTRNIEESINWGKKGAFGGDALAARRIGLAHKQGDGVEKDSIKEKKYFYLSATLGDIYSMKQLGSWYANHNNFSEAFKWFFKAAGRGDAAAQSTLSQYFHEGKGVEKDDIKAFHWAKRSADQGYSSGEGRLGVMYANGLGVSQDFKEAMKWFNKAANHGSAEAMKDIGVMYAKGMGVKNNKQMAIKWYKKAAYNGNESAKKILRYYGIQLGEDYDKDTFKSL